MANIALNKPSGGQLILSPEDGTSTETVTIPSVGVGKVLQAVEGQTNNYTTITSTVYSDMGINVTITPTRADSKIVIIATATIDTQTAAQSTLATIFRDSTNLGTNGYHDNFSYQYCQTSRIITEMTAQVIDSPNTTSAVTYKYMFKCGGSSESFRSYNYVRNSIIALEVAA